MKKNIQYMIVVVMIFLGCSSSKNTDYVRRSKPFLKIGDNIYEYLKRYPVEKKEPVPWLSGLQEGRRISMGTYLDSVRIGVLLFNDSLAYGAIQMDTTYPQVAYDTDGDGHLDLKHYGYFVPCWLYLKCNMNPDSMSKEPDELFNSIYSELQSDSGLREGPELAWRKQIYSSYQKDSTLSNRDCIYLSNYYLEFINSNPMQSLYAAKELERVYHKRFGRIHPYILLTVLEASLNSEDNQTACQYLNRLLSVDSTFIPALYYRYRLEEDSIKTMDYRTQLVRDYPNHWVVKKYFK